MADTVFVRGEGGMVWEMDLPLSVHVAAAVEKGHMRVVNADGTEVIADPPPATPAKKSGKKASAPAGAEEPAVPGEAV